MRTRMTHTKSAGFSLLEVTIVGAILLVASSMAIPTFNSTMQSWHGDSAYAGVYSQLKLASQLAINNRQEYEVIFTPGNSNLTPPQSGTVELDSIVPLQNPPNPEFPHQVSIYTLPSTAMFAVPSGAAGITAPDGFGTGSAAIDFSYPNTPDSFSVYFTADGRVLDSPTGAPVNGVVYISQSTISSWGRAVTVWGYTGKVKGWDLTSTGSVFRWTSH
jgi:type II secretory pathway pseudopilin PulG